MEATYNRSEGIAMQAQHTIKQVLRIDRLNNSVNGNPRYEFTFTDGDRAVSSSDAEFCYTVGNPGMRVGCNVVVEFTRAGRISHMGPAS